MTNLLAKHRHIHFIGVGGIGMSALAAILANRSYSISGSDLKSNNALNDLKKQGIKIFHTQSEHNIDVLNKNFNPLIVISSAVPKNNPELVAAKKENFTICHRSDILAELINKQQSIAIAGTHGKTTTSTLITTLLTKSNQDPTALIGGVMPYFNSNSHSGLGKLLIAEADESDGTLVKFKAQLGVITNLELDHTDHYQNIDELINTMKVFTRNCKQVLANHDCKILRKNIQAFAWWSIKTNKKVKFAGLPVKINGSETIANFYENGKLIGQITIPLPGLHNLSNAVAAIAACRMEGIAFNLLKENIAYLKAPKRRFDFRGIWQGRQFVDDYAHHPSEIKATLDMARLMINSDKNLLAKSPKRLVVIFQPHRYSRIKQFLNDFAIALQNSDLIMLAPIYSAGEKPIEAINNESLKSCIQKHSPTLPVIIAKQFNHLPVLISKYTHEDDLILSMGAGDINQLWEQLQNNKKSNRWTNLRIAA